MPIIKSAKKRLKTSARQTEENRVHRTRARTSIKHIRELLDDGKTAEALAEFPQAQTYIDKAVKTNAMHANAAARQKARLSAALKAAGNKDKTPARVKNQTKQAAAKPAAKKPA